MKAESLLIEIGCEEIPARMIAAAAEDLTARLVKILDDAALAHGDCRHWGGSRRLALHVREVQPRQRDLEKQFTGPPAKVAFGADGAPTAAAIGFAHKQKIDPSELTTIETDRGAYVGYRKRVEGETLAEILGRELPGAVAGMSFPKTMRWSAGRHRWVRPVHWVLALHGATVIPFRLFEIAAGDCSAGHRFLAPGPVRVPHADRYEEALAGAFVVVDPLARRERIDQRSVALAAEGGGSPVADIGLLDEVANLVEWPGVVLGSFGREFLDLPRELLVTTLRYHQKCFSVQGPDGSLLPAFLAVANTDRDPAGHVRRGNEWVVGGRLEDARFFWNEDLQHPLEERTPKLARLIVHKKIGSYHEKARRMTRLATRLAGRLGGAVSVEHCAQAALLSKHDLLTGTVGEFPELQGQVGGLLLARQGQDEEVATAVYSHYLPAGPDDPIPGTIAGRLVSLADKLDTVAEFVRVGEVPTGSRDPFGLRRASNGIFRLIIEGGMPLCLSELTEISEGHESLLEFLNQRLLRFLRDSGYSNNEVLAVVRPRISTVEVREWELPDVVARLEAIRRIRGREDFRLLIKLTERVDTILARNAEQLAGLADGGDPFVETEAAARRLGEQVESNAPLFAESAAQRRYPEVVELLAGFIEPVERFFRDVLVIDLDRPAAVRSRYELLGRLRKLLTLYFDIRELAGQADRRA